MFNLFEYTIFNKWILTQIVHQELYFRQLDYLQWFLAVPHSKKQQEKIDYIYLHAIPNYYTNYYTIIFILIIILIIRITLIILYQLLYYYTSVDKY